MEPQLPRGTQCSAPTKTTTVCELSRSRFSCRRVLRVPSPRLAQNTLPGPPGFSSTCGPPRISPQGAVALASPCGLASAGDETAHVPQKIRVHCVGPVHGRAVTLLLRKSPSAPPVRKATLAKRCLGRTMSGDSLRRTQSRARGCLSGCSRRPSRPGRPPYRLPVAHGWVVGTNCVLRPRGPCARAKKTAAVVGAGACRAVSGAVTESVSQSPTPWRTLAAPR